MKIKFQNDTAKEAYLKYVANRQQNCYWCGTVLAGGYDKTSTGDFLICKGYCHKKRFWEV